MIAFLGLVNIGLATVAVALGVSVSRTTLIYRDSTIQHPAAAHERTQTYSSTL